LNREAAEAAKKEEVVNGESSLRVHAGAAAPSRSTSIPSFAAFAASQLFFFKMRQNPRIAIMDAPAAFVLFS
jgi:hypothetical protein